MKKKINWPVIAGVFIVCGVLLIIGTMFSNWDSGLVGWIRELSNVEMLLIFILFAIWGKK